jgi:hypothetical protein
MNEFTAHCASSGAGLHQFFLESSRSYAQASGEEHLADQVKPFSNARPLWDILASRARIQVDREPNPVGAKEAIFKPPILYFGGPCSGDSRAIGVLAML